jgi:DNA-binding transcriptional MerR regulator
MKTISKLNSIMVDYHNGNMNEFSEEVLVRKKFIDSLKEYPLKEINKLYFSYRVHLKIESTNTQYKYNVFNEDILFFSFYCKEDKDFIEIFEQELKNNLIKFFKGDTSPSAGISMDGNK